MSISIKHGKIARQNTFRHDVGAGEFHVANTGVSYSEPAISAYFRARSPLADTPLDEPWLRRESEAILAMSGVSQTTFVEGDLGAGKSTALFGVRTLLRNAGVPYVAINGHYLNKGRSIAAAIGRATRAGNVVVYDSLDYLVVGRKENHHAKHARGPVMAAIVNHAAEGGRLIATMHTDPWLRRHSSPELIAGLGELAATTGAVHHRVYGYIPDTDELSALCARAVGPGYASMYPAYAEGSSEPTASTYRVAKLIGKRHGEAGLSSMSQAIFDETIRGIDEADRIAVGAAPDYALLPPEICQPNLELALA